jgi:hypothetical protein
MKLMGHSTVTVSQRYVDAASESMKLPIARLSGVPTESSTELIVLKRRRVK